MLILTRHPGEKLIIGESGDVIITVLSVKGNQAKIGIQAAEFIPVHREEIYHRIQSSQELVTSLAKPQVAKAGEDGLLS